MNTSAGHGTKRAKGNARGSGFVRNADDWYVEPPHAVRALFEAEPFTGDVWDPACGRGTIPRVAREYGLNAYGTDLMHRAPEIWGTAGSTDFMDWEPQRVENIVSNPPYDIIGKFTARALSIATRKVAIFARLALLEGVERGAWFPTTPFKRVLVFSGRVSCPPGQDAPAFEAPIEAWSLGGAVAYAWFIWEHGYTGQATVGFLPPPKCQTGRLALAA